MFTFTMEDDDGRKFEAKATSRDVLIWEKTGRNRSVTKLGEDPQMSEMYALAYIASKRTKVFDGTLADFEQTVDLDFDLEVVGEKPDPIQRDR